MRLRGDWLTGQTRDRGEADGAEGAHYCLPRCPLPSRWFRLRTPPPGRAQEASSDWGERPRKARSVRRAVHRSRKLRGCRCSTRFYGRRRRAQPAVSSSGCRCLVLGAPPGFSLDPLDLGARRIGVSGLPAGISSHRRRLACKATTHHDGHGGGTAPAPRRLEARIPPSTSTRRFGQRP